MIFVTVGMHHQGFDRLIQKMDEIAGKHDEKVIMQIGSASYAPVHAHFFSYLPDEQLMGYYQDARVIVAHAGAGTILTALTLNKPVIVVPRLKKYNENGNDQQTELAEAISHSKLGRVVTDMDDLEEAISSMPQWASPLKKNAPLIANLKACLQEIENENLHNHVQ